MKKKIIKEMKIFLQNEKRHQLMTYDALVGQDDLSEEFKTESFATIFEAALNSKVKEIAQKEGRLQQKLN